MKLFTLLSTGGLITAMKIHASRLLFFLFITGLGTNGAARADPYWDSDCRGLKLKDASGVPQNSKHTYSFAGTCQIFVVTDSSTMHRHTVPAVAQGTWDGSAKTFNEKLRVLNEVHIPGPTINTGSSIFGSSNVHMDNVNMSQGSVESTFQCDKDPLVSGASCTRISHWNGSGFEPFSNPALKQNRPMLKGKTTLAEATDLSKKHVGTVTPAEWPKPEKKPVTAGSTAPVNVGAVPSGQLNVPPSPIRGSGGFVPDSGKRSAAPSAPAVAMRETGTEPNVAASMRLLVAPLAIVGAGSKIDPNCQPQQPAAWVNVTIKSSGSAPTGQGVLYMKEVGGANLNGSKYFAPIAAGQTTLAVSTPLTTSVPYSKLAGAHQIAVYLNPPVENGAINFGKSAPHMLTVTFPPGHCVVQRQASPAAGDSASAKVPAVQVNPGAPNTRSKP